MPEGLEGHQLVGLINISLSNFREGKKKQKKENLLSFRCTVIVSLFSIFEVECQVFRFVLFDGLYFCLCCFSLK